MNITKSITLDVAIYLLILLVNSCINAAPLTLVSEANLFDEAASNWRSISVRIIPQLDGTNKVCFGGIFGGSPKFFTRALDAEGKLLNTPVNNQPILPSGWTILSSISAVDSIDECRFSVLNNQDQNSQYAIISSDPQPKTVVLQDLQTDVLTINATTRLFHYFRNTLDSNASTFTITETPQTITKVLSMCGTRAGTGTMYALSFEEKAIQVGYGTDSPSVPLINKGKIVSCAAWDLIWIVCFDSNSDNSFVSCQSSLMEGSIRLLSENLDVEYSSPSISILDQVEAAVVMLTNYSTYDIIVIDPNVAESDHLPDDTEVFGLTSHAQNGVLAVVYYNSSGLFLRTYSRPTSPPLAASPTKQIPIPNGQPLSNAIGSSPIAGPGPEVLGPAIAIPIGVVLGLGIFLLVFFMRKKNKKNNNGEKMNTINPASVDIDKRLHIPYKSLVFDDMIGTGSYGKVYKGEWRGAKVAIKVSNTITDVDGFLAEAKLVLEVAPHPNLVQPFGVSLDGPNPCIVLEFCGGGSLDVALFDSIKPFTEIQKREYALKIAYGLLHLHNNNIIHRDLAARNILLTKDGEPKISDLGMSRVVHEEGSMGKTKTSFGPVRWMAPESLKDKTYSTKSDVELRHPSAGMEPHTTEDQLTVAVKIRDDGLTPVIPSDCDPVLKQVMEMCWRPNPNDRPSMEEIVALLRN